MLESRNRIQIGFFAALLIGALLLNYLIFRPYISVLFMALILVIIFKPVHERIKEKLKSHRNIASLLSTFIVILAILVPISFFGSLIFKDAQNFYQDITSDGIDRGVFLSKIADFQILVDEIAPAGSNVNITAYLQSVLETIVQNLGSFFAGIFTLVFQIFLLVLALFYFFRDGEKFRAHFIGLSPLSDRYDRTILGRLESAINAVVRGVLLIALIQGVVSGIGFAIFGVPNPMLWAAVAAVAALIPTIGTALVIVPAVLYLFLTGGLGSAIGLALWGGVAVGLIDNILAPIFIERGLKIHPFLILLSVLGGVAFLGPVGFLAGPVILTLLFALFDLYPVVIEGRTPKESALIE